MEPKDKRVLLALWMGGEFGRDVHVGVRERLAARGLRWRLRFANSAASFDAVSRWLLRQGLIDGAITCFSEQDQISDLASAVPVVLLSRDEPQGPEAARLRGARVASVALDTADVASTAVSHFLERAGFRSAGFVESSRDKGWSALRGDMVLERFAARGIPGSRFRHWGGPSENVPGAEPDFDGLERWLRSAEKPAAVVAANDATAADVVEICEKAGLAVPRDVAVLGMDDDQVFCRLCEPNVSSIRFDGRQAGRLCVDALAAMLDGETPPEGPLLYGVSFVARRASTGAVSTAGALVQKALDYIDANACRGVSMGDVVRHLGVSRTLAALRFREVRGESIHSAIRARRVAEARRLLSDTDMLLDEIAAACGFDSANGLRRAYRAVAGEAPSERRRNRGSAR